MRNLDQFKRHSERAATLLQSHREFLAKHTPSGREKFTVPGYSYTAGRQVEFLVDYKHSGESGNILWRQSVLCPETYFNNRMRAAFHLFDLEMDPYPDLNLYISEQVTPIYRYFSERFPRTVGSEFLGTSSPSGSVNLNGIRNEDLRQLTFPDDSFEAIVSLDVFEHIPSYFSAFKECARILKPEGRMMWSVPFAEHAALNIVRAEIVDGQIHHIPPPQYHGDPLSDRGVLCFQIFGWEMLDQMKDAGFRDAYAICFHSAEFGYLGQQFMFFAVK